MNTANQTYPSFARTEKAPLTLSAVLAAVFMVKLRESLADQSASECAYGL